MRLSDRARRRKLRLIEEDEIVPKKRHKGVKPIVKPVTKPIQGEVYTGPRLENYFHAQFS